MLEATTPCRAPTADRAGAAETGLGAAEDLLLDDQALLAVGVLDQPRRPVAESRVDVMVPQIERLEHMAIGIDDVIGATHQRFPRDLIEDRGILTSDLRRNTPCELRSTSDKFVRESTEHLYRGPTESFGRTTRCLDGLKPFDIRLQKNEIIAELLS